MDRNKYYGGSDAALSLQDAKEWVKTIGEACTPGDGESGKEFQNASQFSNASITYHEASSNDGSSTSPSKLSFSRAYSLALAPQLINANSRLVSSLVKSQVADQIDFTAMGSWWHLADEHLGNNEERRSPLIKVPNTREDLLDDSDLDRSSKRALIKFLRSVISSSGQDDNTTEAIDMTLSEYLSSRFNLPIQVQRSLHALSMLPTALTSTSAVTAIKRIAQHLQSIGVFGPAFGALIPRYGGLAEIAQVTCRAGAVGGGVYMLGNGVKEVKSDADLAVMGGYTDPKRALRIELEQGEHLSTQWLVKGAEDLSSSEELLEECCRSITIVSSPLTSLFPPLGGENGQTPTGAVVSIRDTRSNDESSPPVYIIAHSSDTGDCPAGQCKSFIATYTPFDTIPVTIT